MGSKNPSNFFYVGANYRKELKKQVRLLIIFTLALTIAFAWREAIFGMAKNFMVGLTGAEHPGFQDLLASIFLTLLSGVLILLTSKYLKDPVPYDY